MTCPLEPRKGSSNGGSEPNQVNPEAVLLGSKKQRAIFGIAAGLVLGTAFAGVKHRQRLGNRVGPASQMIQVKDRLELQRKWKQRKNQPVCQHPLTVPEYYNDKPTGYSVCKTCGYSVK